MKRREMVQASENGVLLIRKACKAKSWVWNADHNNTPLIEASIYLEPNKHWPLGQMGNIYADSINQASWRRFLMGNKIALKAFVAYCHALKISWESVVNLDFVDDALPLDLSYCSYSVKQKSINEKDSSEFIRDVTIPDGSIVEANATFTKVWEVRNSGNLAWTNRYLTRIGKNQGFGLIISPRRVKIPRTPPGQKVLIEVELKAPEAGGTYQAIWKMTFPDGSFCFPDRYKYGLFVTVNVMQ